MFYKKYVCMNYYYIKTIHLIKSKLNQLAYLFIN